MYKIFTPHQYQKQDNNSDFNISEKLKSKFFVENKEDRYDETIELYNVCRILNELNVKYWIDFGTLLGAYRENKLISHDVDIDISLILRKKIELYEITINLSRDFYIRHFDETYVSLYPKNNPNFGYSHIDLYVFEESHDTKLVTSKIYGYENLIYRTYFFREMDIIKIKDFTFPCPTHLDDYLSSIYGEDYITPQSDWNGYSNKVINPEKVKSECIAVYLTGVFDLFHIGHVNIFKNIKKYFDKLIVGIHNDSDVMTYKDKPFFTYKDRIEIVKSCKYVDEVIENAELYVSDKFLDSIGAKYLIYGREIGNNNVKKYYEGVSSNRHETFPRTEDISSSEIKCNLKDKFSGR